MGLSTQHSRPEGVILGKTPSRCQERAPLHGGQWAACLGSVHADVLTSIPLPWEPWGNGSPCPRGHLPSSGSTDGQSMGRRGPDTTYLGTHPSCLASCPQRNPIDLKIMLNRIMLRPSGGDHAGVNIPRMLGALGKCCRLGFEVTSPSRLPTVAMN